MKIKKLHPDRLTFPKCSAMLSGITREFWGRIDKRTHCQNNAAYLIDGRHFCRKHAAFYTLDKTTGADND